MYRCKVPNTGISLSGIGGAVHLFSDISGGQFNPAVSFGLFFARKLSLIKAILFSVVQLCGGLVAGGKCNCANSVSYTVEVVRTGE